MGNNYYRRVRTRDSRDTMIYGLIALGIFLLNEDDAESKSETDTQDSAACCSNAAKAIFEI